MGSERDRNRTLLVIVGVLAAVLIAGVVLSNYTVELGLARPSEGAVRVAVGLAEVGAVLDRGGDFREFSEALRASQAMHRLMSVSNPADGRVDAEAGRALDCYAALRQAWQAELEGAWDPAVHGDPSYWRAFHSSVELRGAGIMSPAELREALGAEAAIHVSRALSVVER